MLKTTPFLSLMVVAVLADQTLAEKPKVLGPVAVVHFQVPGGDGPAFEPQPEPQYAPAPAPPARQPVPVYPPAPAPGAGQPAPMPGTAEVPALELYRRVRYKDHDEKHPRAVTTIVSVPDPATGWKRKYVCAPPMVHVAICVPPNCGPPKVDYKSLFREYEFDFGKYAVDVRLRDGGIEVDYQD